ncbi:MAG: CpaE family protein [Micrococcales bacterium]
MAPINFGQLNDLITAKQDSSAPLQLNEKPQGVNPNSDLVAPTSELTAPSLQLSTQPEPFQPKGHHRFAVPPAQGTTVAFRSLIAGQGKSVLALNFAFEAAALGNSVCLVDLDLTAPTLNRYFGLVDAKSAVTALARLIGQQRFDQSSLESTVVTIEAKGATLDLLTSASASTALGNTDPIEVLLEYLALRYQVVVIDVGSGSSTELHQICDRVATSQYLVVQADPVSLGRHLAAESGSVALPNARLVVNRVRQSSLGAKPEWQVSQVLGARSSHEIAAFVPDHGEASDRAMLSGIPLRQAAPKSPALQAISVLVANQLSPTRQSKKLGRMTKL